MRSSPGSSQASHASTSKRSLTTLSSRTSPSSTPVCHTWRAAVNFNSLFSHHERIQELHPPLVRIWVSHAWYSRYPATTLSNNRCYSSRVRPRRGLDGRPCSCAECVMTPYL